jgi:hypothetical protein
MVNFLGAHQSPGMSYWRGQKLTTFATEPRYIDQTSLDAAFRCGARIIQVFRLASCVA